MDPDHGQPTAATNTTTQSSEDAELPGPASHQSSGNQNHSDELSRGLASEKSDLQPPSEGISSDNVQLPQIFQSDIPDLSLPFGTPTWRDGYNVVRSSFEVSAASHLISSHTALG
jgi:hypothetical protein